MANSTHPPARTGIVAALIADGHLSPEDGESTVLVHARFRAQRPGFCDRCDTLIHTGEQITRTDDNQLLCRRCAG
jgi:hypothetical protein